MKAWFMGLAPRERLLAGMAAVIGILVMIYGLAWHPLSSRVAYLHQSIDEQEQLKRWMQQTATEVKRLQGAGVAVAEDHRSLLAVVDQTSKEAQLGMAVKRIQPEGQDLVRVSLEQANFDDVVMWLGGLQHAHGVSVVDAAIDRQKEPGRVNARLTLKKSGA